LTVALLSFLYENFDIVYLVIKNSVYFYVKLDSNLSLGVSGSPGFGVSNFHAGIAQLGERQTEDLKVACSIHAHRIFFRPGLHFLYQVNTLILTAFELLKFGLSSTILVLVLIGGSGPALLSEGYVVFVESSSG
jgi:hypothetical protein